MSRHNLPSHELVGRRGHSSTVSDNVMSRIIVRPCAFTGAGSFYRWASWGNTSVVGLRSCVDEHQREHRAVDYTQVFADRGAWSRLPADHPLKTQRRTTWLQIGDSTEREATRDWCNQMQSVMRSIPAGAPRPAVRRWVGTPIGFGFGLSRPHLYDGCTISGFGDASQDRNFSLVAYMVFGVLNVREMWNTATGSDHSLSKPKPGSSVWLAHSLVLKQGDPVDTPARIRLSRVQVGKAALQLEASEGPTFLTLHSCLWDMNGRDDNTGN
eukprot:7386625-Prymnesium_polylepis.1